MKIDFKKFIVESDWRIINTVFLYSLYALWKHKLHNK